MENPFRFGGKFVLLIAFIACKVSFFYFIGDHLFFKLFFISHPLFVYYQAISASSSEVPYVLEFLQRRKLEANKVA